MSVQYIHLTSADLRHLTLLWESTWLFL